MSKRHALQPYLVGLALLAGAAVAVPAQAQSATRTKKAHTSHAAKKTAPVEVPIADAGPEQVKAAGMVYYGKYDCEFNQKIDIAQSTQHSGYVDLKLGRSDWLMRPVLSSTGAIRLEDVRGEMLMVQIAAKSMLLDVKTGHRLVDDCISVAQRQLLEAAKAASAAS